MQHQLRILCMQDNSIRLWNLETQVCVVVINGEGCHTNEVLSIVRNLTASKSTAIAAIIQRMLEENSVADDSACSKKTSSGKTNVRQMS